MIFLSDAAGVITAAIPEAINQGSIGVNRIVLIAPFPSNAVVSATFTLPNGIKIYPRYVGETPEDNYPYLMGVVEAFGDGGLSIDGVTVNAWQLTLDKAITQVAGNVTVQFLVTGINGTLTTTSATLPINRGNAYLAPSVSVDDLNKIAGYLAAANNAANEAGDFASEAEGYAENAAAEFEKAKEEADRAKEQADRYSPWDIVITQDNVLAVLNTLAAAPYKSILFFGVDFTSLNLERFIVNGRETFNFPATAEKVEFRGCQIGNVPLVLVGNESCNIIGASDRLLNISTFGSVENCTANEILGCDHVSNCTATNINDCNNVTGCTATQMNNCAKVSASKANAFSGCTYVDPYSVEGRVAVDSKAVGQAAVLTANGSYVTAPLASRLVLSVSSADYKVTATLYDRTGGIMSTATIDLPLESVVVGATVSEDGTKLILTLQNGTTVDVPISDIFRGIATEEWVKENTIVKLESEYDEQVYLQDAEGNVSLKQVSWEKLKPYAVVRRNSSGDVIIGPTTNSIDGAISKGQMHTYVDGKLHVGPEAPTASDATLWVDTDEEGESTGSSSGGGKLYLHTITGVSDYSFEGGPYAEGVVCKFYSYNSAAITSLSEIPITRVHLPNVVAFTSIGLTPFAPKTITVKNNVLTIYGYTFYDGDEVSHGDFHSWYDTVTEVI